MPPAPIDSAANASKLEQRSLDGPAVAAALQQRARSRPADGRWSLDELTLAAWVLRPEVAVARAEVDAAHAAAAVDSRRPNPPLDGSVERVGNPTENISPWVVGASLGLVIETGGKRGIRRDRALAREQALEWQLAETMWRTRADLRRALLNRTLAARTLALDDQEVGLRRDYLDWIDTKLRYGAATSQDRLAASEARSRAESQRDLDAAALASASAGLAAAAGVRSLPALAPVDLDALPDFAAADLERSRELALTHRLDVRRALADYDVAEQDLRAAVAAQYPNFTLGPGYLFDQGARKITLTPNLPVSLFHSGRPAVEQAVATRRVAALKFDQVQADALAAVDRSIALYRATTRALASAEGAEREASATLAAARRRLAAGAADRGEVLGAGIDRVLRERNTLDARRAVVDAMSALEDAVQRPLFPASTLQLASQGRTQAPAPQRNHP